VNDSQAQRISNKPGERGKRLNRLFFRCITIKVLLCALTVAAPVCATVLEYTVSGVKGEVRKNVESWLGKPPQTAQARSNFLFTARERIDSAMKALGYYQAAIDMEVVREEPVWELLVDIETGPAVTISSVDISLTGEAEADPAFARLMTEIPLHAGEQLHHGQFEGAKRKLQSLGQQRGYFDGKIVQSRVAVESIAGTAEVVIHYSSGQRYHFGPLVFDETAIAGDLVYPLLAFEAGAPYDQALLQQSQAQLQRTGYFSAVIMRPLIDKAQDHTVPLQLDAFPAKRHSFDVGLGFSTDTEERVSFTWRTPRLNSLGHSQETRLQYSRVNPSGRFTYTIPLRHPLNDVLLLSARWEDNEFGDLDSLQKEIAVRREKKKNAWVYGYNLRALHESWNATGVRRENQYLLPGASLSRRFRRGPLVDPDEGFSQYYRAEAGGKNYGSDIDLTRLLANFGHIASFGARHRLVSRAELGAVFLADGERDDLAPSLSFFAGGSQSIRGFAYQSIGSEIEVSREDGETRRLVIGGNRLLTGSVEYQYRVNKNWRAAVFLDAGDAFDAEDFNLNYGAGFGVHYMTQVGAVRVELANPISKDNPAWRLHFSVGAEF